MVLFSQAVKDTVLDVSCCAKPGAPSYVWLEAVVSVQALSTQCLWPFQRHRSLPSSTFWQFGLKVYGAALQQTNFSLVAAQNRIV